MARATAGRACCGKVNTTEIGCIWAIITKPVVSGCVHDVAGVYLPHPGQPVERGR